MYEPSGRQFPFVAFLWPAMAAASASEFAATLAKQFVDLAVGPGEDGDPGVPPWTTANRVALRIKTASLRDFSTAADGMPTLLVTPFALHGSTIVDIAPGYSLIAALRDAGLTRLFATNWHSATPDMRFLGIDNYLADLNVLVDEMGGRVNLVGLCQGGWMALLFAARFPGKVAKLVLAGAPIDVTAGDSGLSALAASSPLEVFHELVSIGDGRVLGRAMLQFWGSGSVETAEIGELLQVPDPVGSPAYAQIERTFRRWYAWTVDLPGQFYLEVIEKLYKQNELSSGRFIALGQRVDLKKVQMPIFLLAARDDEVVAPAQLFAAKRLVGTSADNMETDTVDCRHIGLFMGREALRGPWPKIARWITAPDAIAPPLDGTDAGDTDESAASRAPARAPL
jgi:pimeloyl-ACP methyl ester carboxylesterase